MELHDPRAERALILAVTDDQDFADAVAAERAARPSDERGWLELTAPAIVARTEQRAVGVCAAILDLQALAARLRDAERPSLIAGVERIVRSAHAAYLACRALIPAAERADSMEELAG